MYNKEQIVNLINENKSIYRCNQDLCKKIEQRIVSKFFEISESEVLNDEILDSIQNSKQFKRWCNPYLEGLYLFVNVCERLGQDWEESLPESCEDYRDLVCNHFGF